MDHEKYLSRTWVDQSNTACRGVHAVAGVTEPRPRPLHVHSRRHTTRTSRKGKIIVVE